MIAARSQIHREVAEVVRLQTPKSQLQTPKSHDFGYMRGVATTLVAVWLAAATVWADPAGSVLRVDQQATIRIGAKQIGVEYSATLNRPGAFQEFMAIDANGDGELSMAEQKKYFDQIGRQIMAGLEITAGGRELPLRQAGEMLLVMPFTKKFHFEADPPADWKSGVELEFHNDNFLAQDGDIAIRVAPADGVKLNFCSLPAEGEGEQTLEGAVVPPPSFAPRQQRDVVVRYSGDGEFDAPPRYVGAATSLQRAASANGAVTTSLETVLLGGVIVAFGLLAILVVVARWRGVRVSRRRVALAAALACLAVLCAAWSVRGAIARTSADVRPISNDEAKAIFRSLHENIYSAFQAKTENDIYDVLAASLDGDLLSRTYLQVSRLAMSDDAASGFYVRRVKPLASKVLSGDARTNPGFRVRHRWQVYGVVSHFGHRHARVNQYDATFSVHRHGSGWRITGVDLRGYHRADPGLLFASAAP